MFRQDFIGIYMPDCPFVILRFSFFTKFDKSLLIIYKIIYEYTSNSPPLVLWPESILHFKESRLLACYYSKGKIMTVHTGKRRLICR